MKERLAHLITHLYPSWWRDRYGEEFEALLLAQPGSLRNIIDVACSAFRERIASTHSAGKRQIVPSLGAVVKMPSAAIPITMSLFALAVVLVHVATSGVARQADEGAAAHLWQLLMAGQIPVLLFFAVKWLPKVPKIALYVLALQAAAIGASMAPVFILKW
jgi:hypothetical protein